MTALACVPLSSVPEAATTLARWFLAEWPEHYAGRTVSEVEADFPVVDNGGLPLILAACRDGELCGTAALRESSILNFAALSPWLGGLYVHPSCRRSGVARALIGAVEQEARLRGYPVLYAGTVHAHAVFDRLGWTRVADTVQAGEPVTVYEKSL